LSSPRCLFVIAGGVVVYAGLMFFNPIRASLRDGLRCIRRYHSTWGMLALFGFCYAAFQLALRVFYYAILPESERPIFQWSRAWFLPKSSVIGVLQESWLPALENIAGTFNNLVTTYPFSALAAFLLLTNWEGHYVVLHHAVKRRFPRSGWIIYLGILICALAALVKPLLYAVLPALGHYLPGLHLLQGAVVVDWLSFLFEYMLGICIQIYLILLVYVWIRGVNYTRAHLLDFAIRRFSYVMKWACLVMLLSTLFIHLPLIALNVPPFSGWLSGEKTLEYIDRVARPTIAVCLILFATVQITLTFHSESFRKAVRDHLAFLRVNAGAMIWFILIAGINFFLINALNLAVARGLGEATMAGLIWRLIYPIFWALVAAWMLATWVCVFKRSDTGRTQKDDWIKF
jgi:hypothetical protein